MVEKPVTKTGRQKHNANINLAINEQPSEIIDYWIQLDDMVQENN